MTRIAFCDDDAALLHQMQDFLEQYRTLRGVQLELAPYTKPMELLADIEAGVRFDVLFLDVLMPGINGINAAREIRRYDTAVQIIFVTSSSEFAVQFRCALHAAAFPLPGLGAVPVRYRAAGGLSF